MLTKNTYGHNFTRIRRGRSYAIRHWSWKMCAVKLTLIAGQSAVDIDSHIPFWGAKFPSVPSFFSPLFKLKAPP
jgi:hypothetical protein